MRGVLTIISLLFFQYSYSREIRVGKTCSVHSIAQALRMAETGDTVTVTPGLYREGNLVISRMIVLRGIQKPILDGENKYEILSVKAGGVIIDGFTIINSGVSSLEDISGIKVYDQKNVIIRNNHLKDNFFGIFLQNSSACIIQNNRIAAMKSDEQSSGNGIHCWKCDSIQVIGNEVSGQRDGIYFEFVTNSVIWRNRSVNNIRYGLHFMFSHNDAYISNLFTNNGAGVSVMFTHGVKMYNNIFENNWGDGSYGLLLKEISDSYIEGNRFLANTSGIYMEGASRILMRKNVFKNNGWGLKIQASCLKVEVTENNFIGNSFDIGTNGTLVLNSFNHNYWDKYEGYDLNKDQIGDIPYRPVSMYSMIVEKNPPAMLLFRSFMTTLLDKTEKILPALTPEGLKDNRPAIKKLF